MVLFGDDADALLEARDRIGAWLARERRLVRKDPDARRYGPIPRSRTWDT